MWAYVRAESLGRDEINSRSKDLLEEFGEIEKTLKGLLAGGKLDEHIDVTADSTRVACHRAEQRKAMYAQREDPLADPSHAVHHLLSRHWGRHTVEYSLPVTGAGRARLTLSGVTGRSTSESPGNPEVRRGVSTLGE